MVATNISLVLTVLAAGCLLGAVQAGDYPEAEGRHELKWGKKGTGDVQLFKDELTISAKPFLTQSHDVCYPSAGSRKKVNITYYKVEAVNKQGLAYLHKMNKTDKRQACFHLKTLRGKGYHFKIQVWGTKNALCGKFVCF